MTLYSPQQIAYALLHAGAPPEQVPTLTAIAMAEGGDYRGSYSEATNDSAIEYSVGPFQINLRAHPDITESAARTLQSAADFAVSLFRSPNSLNHWSVYQNGSYRQYLPIASSATQQVLDTVTSNQESGREFVTDTEGNIQIGPFQIPIELPQPVQQAGTVLTTIGQYVTNPANWARAILTTVGILMIAGGLLIMGFALIHESPTITIGRSE